jgi:hypothetical protein
VTLAVTGNIISGQDFRRSRMSVSQRHRAAVDGNR